MEVSSLAVVCERLSAARNRWVFKNQEQSVGYIHRNTLDDGFSLSHSVLHAQHSVVSTYYEPGELLNFVFMLKGRIKTRFTRAAGWFEMQAGNTYVFASRDAELLRSVSRGQKVEAVVVKLCPEAVQQLAEDTHTECVAIPREQPLSMPHSSAVPLLCRKITDVSYTGVTGDILAKAGAVELLLVSFFRERQKGAPRDVVLLKEIADHITANLDQEHDLAVLSRMAGMSHTKLNRLFRQHWGTSVFEFIRREKLARAEDYLKNTNMSITEIAYCTGYCSSSHFCSSFRREKGVSPSCFREHY